MDRFNRDRKPLPMPVTGGLLATGGPDRNRDSLFLLARIRFAEDEQAPDRWMDVRVRNLSPGGLMAELDEPMAIGSPVELELRGVGLVSGRIAWQAEGRTGVAFDTPIDPMKARKPVGARRSRTAAPVPGAR